MLRLLWVFLCFLMLWSPGLWGAEEESPSLKTLADFPIRAIEDIPTFIRGANPLDNPEAYGWLLALTGLMVAYDQPVIDESQRFARGIGLIGPDDDGRKTQVISHNRVFGIDANLHIPKSPNTMMYYLGDGLTSVIITGGLISYSLIAKDFKAMSTASQILEALMLNGSVIITSKMATGRESPFRATRPGGQWRGFVGFRNYLEDVSKHDAFPSGHIATAMTTIRVLAENYASYTWINPLGYSAMTLLMFAMLNNGVHWLSDFPLGIAIGYHAAGVVLHRHGVASPKDNSSSLLQGVQLVQQGEYLGLRKTWVF